MNTVAIDEWTEWDCNQAQAGVEKPVEYLEFNDDPLALVCAMLRRGKQYGEIAEVLHGNYQTRVTRAIMLKLL